MWLSLFVPLAVIVVAVGLEQLETMLLQRRSRAAAGAGAGAHGLPTPAAQDDGASDGRGRRGPGTRRRPP
jgi:hypothetical protein